MVLELEQGLKALNDLLVRAQQAEASLSVREQTLADAVDRMSFQLNALAVYLGVATLVIGVLAVVVAIEGAKRSATDFLNKTGTSLIETRLKKVESESSRRLDEKVAEIDKKLSDKLDDFENLAREARGRKG